MAAPTRSAHRRGLGHRHRKVREALLRRHVDGTPCWWCGQPMFRDPARNFDYNPDSRDPGNGALAADHTHARTHGGITADRLLHGICNKERGDGRRDHLRPAVTGRPVGAAVTVAPELGFQAMNWPW
jgi:hypothetical protein